MSKILAYEFGFFRRSRLHTAIGFAAVGAVGAASYPVIVTVLGFWPAILVAAGGAAFIGYLFSK